MTSLLTKLADELLVQDITEPSAVLGPLSDEELQAAYDFVLERFALEPRSALTKIPGGPMGSW